MVLHLQDSILNLHEFCSNDRIIEVSVFQSRNNILRFMFMSFKDKPLYERSLEAQAAGKYEHIPVVILATP